MFDSRVQSVTDPPSLFSNTNRAVAPFFVHWINAVALLIASEESAMVALTKLPRCGAACRFQNKKNDEKRRC